MHDAVGKLGQQVEVVPDIYESGFPEVDGVRSVFYDGVPYKGRPTRVFAYLAIPEVGPGEKVPGIVLVHGGLGSAFRRWVRFWRDLGYAAISMDTCGCISGNEFGDEDGGHRHHDDGGPQGWGNFALADDAPEDQWPFHAASAVIRANSLLRTLPEVDPSRIAITGVSWGGWLTCLCTGVDHRFACAGPVYGCGFIGEDSVWKDNGHDGASEEQWRTWLSIWEPGCVLSQARCPFVWVDGSNDFAYPLSILQKSISTVRMPSSRAIIVRMPHAHSAVSERPKELVAFFASRLKGGPAYPSCAEFRLRDGIVSARFARGGFNMVRAELAYTADKGHWQEREWKTVAAEWNPVECRASAVLPEGATAWYVSAFTEDGLTVSSDVDAVDWN